MSWNLTSEIIPLRELEGDFSSFPDIAFREIKVKSLEFPLEANIYTHNVKIPCDIRILVFSKSWQFPTDFISMIPCYCCYQFEQNEGRIFTVISHQLKIEDIDIVSFMMDI